MNTTNAHQQYRQQMIQRIQQADQKSQSHLPDTASLFSATRELRKALEAQLQDSDKWAAILEGGDDQDQALAVQLQDYSWALETALDETRPAPHYQAVRSSLEHKLDPDQEERVRESGVLDQVGDVSLENALAAGYDTLQGRHSNQPEVYREAKTAWDKDCSAGTVEGELIGYTPMAPLRSQVREVLSPEQLTDADHRQLDAMMISHTPMATRMGVDTLELYAERTYGTPMTAPTVEQTQEDTLSVLPQLHQGLAHQHQTHNGPSLG